MVRLSNFLVCLLSTAIFLVVTELTLQLLPVDDATKIQSVDADNPILRFEPNREVVWSRGWNFENIRKKHVNNKGFVDNQDYVDGQKIVAIIGDSYIEAMRVPYDNTIQGRLARDLSSKNIKAYSFGASGAPLSQYLAYAEYADSTFDPLFLVFTIIRNDFHTSLLRDKSQPGFHYFSEEAGDLKLTRVDYKPSFFKRILRKSALIRYLFFNVGAKTIWYWFASDVADVPPRVSENIISRSERVVQEFLRVLDQKKYVPNDRVIFAIDGLRNAIYSSSVEDAKGSYFWRMRQYFLQEARSFGFQVIDLQEVFAKEFAARHLAFEFENDRHWNGYAHGVVFEQIRKIIQQHLALEISKRGAQFGG